MKTAFENIAEAAKYLIPEENFGWGAWIRTREWRNQNPLPYHLATPHFAALRRRLARGAVIAAARGADHTGMPLRDQSPGATSQPVAEIEGAASSRKPRTVCEAAFRPGDGFPPVATPPSA